VKKSATEDEIKKAYRKEALKVTNMAFIAASG
jgi:hypothetical protein